MRKSEFMDLLKYYFRKADKDDLKGIIEDCEEQFRLGAKEGKSEEEICVKLGSPKNIYRYYIGKPIIPEDNPRLPGDDYDTPRSQRRNAAPYDWEKDPDRLRRRAQSQQYYRDGKSWDDTFYDNGNPPQNRRSYDDDGYYDSRRPRRRGRSRRPSAGEDFEWNKDDSLSRAGKAAARPVLDIMGTLFSVLSGMIYAVLFLAIIACLFLVAMPSYLFFGLVPMPPISGKTMIFLLLTILFAGMTASSAASALHAAAKSPKERRA